MVFYIGNLKMSFTSGFEIVTFFLFVLFFCNKLYMFFFIYLKTNKINYNQYIFQMNFVVVLVCFFDFYNFKNFLLRLQLEVSSRPLICNHKGCFKNLFMPSIVDTLIF